MTRLDGKTAIITGAGSGIGQAIAYRFADEGARVAVVDLDFTAAERTVAAAHERGGDAVAVQADVTDLGQANAAVASIVERWGQVDILVNNAGWDRMEPFVKNTPDFWDKLIAINLRGPIHFSRAVLDGMIARQAGKIIFIGSDAGRVGSSGEAVYAACKGGVIALAKTLAREHARDRINVNVVCPGPTDTPFIARLRSEPVGAKIMDALARAIPFGRLAQPHEVAAAVTFFASADADFITGQVLSVSGGMTMV